MSIEKQAQTHIYSILYILHIWKDFMKRKKCSNSTLKSDSYYKSIMIE